MHFFSFAFVLGARTGWALRRRSLVKCYRSFKEALRTGRGGTIYANAPASVAALARTIHERAV